MKWRFGKKLGDFAFRPIELDRRITIEGGSVRSGKTWSLQPKILYASSPECKVGGRRVLFGVSKQTIYRDVLADLIDVIGPKNFSMNKQTGEFTICGCPWQSIGAKDEGSEKYLRGATIGIAIGNELTLFPQGFWQMLLSRLSPPGARVYGTTNPDSPYHWLYTDYIQNQKLIESGDLEYIHATMDDNPNLTPEFIEQQKRQYSGVFYNRFIEGKWVVAEGAIYGDALTDAVFYDDATRPVGLLGQGGYVARYIGVDYGTTNPCVFLEFYDDGKTLWQESEKYWDSKVERRQKTDAEYADDLLEFIGPNRRGVIVVIDPSAASFKVELQKRGIPTKDANNDVLDGIRRVSSLLTSGRYRIHKKNCPKTVSEMSTYSWDAKAALHGKEQPIKANDHTNDAARYVIHTMIPIYRIAAA